MTDVDVPITAPQIDEGIVSQLVDMGFSREGCKKAVFHTGGTGVEPAMNWVVENMDKPGQYRGAPRTTQAA